MIKDEDDLCERTPPVGNPTVETDNTQEHTKEGGQGLLIDLPC